MIIWVIIGVISMATFTAFVSTQMAAGSQEAPLNLYGKLVRIIFCNALEIVRNNFNTTLY